MGPGLEKCLYQNCLFNEKFLLIMWDDVVYNIPSGPEIEIVWNNEWLGEWLNLTAFLRQHTARSMQST